MTKNRMFDPLLVPLGWNEFFQTSFNENSPTGCVPGRVISQGKGHYHVQLSPQVVIEASITNELRNSAKTALDFPGVGDWVSLIAEQGTAKATIQRILQRKSLIQRKRAGSNHQSQLLVTNVDFVFITTSLNEDFDLPRLGRYLALCKDSGAKPILLLTKIDLCDDPDRYVHLLQSEFGDVKIFKVSNHDSKSIDLLQCFFSQGLTSVLLGSSGVGKSTLTNYLLGAEFQKTRDVSADARGRHTTTSRNLYMTRWGGLVIDTPGMQEISMLNANEGIQKNFDDVEALMLKCKFTNCRHGNDPGCAISSSLKKGTLPQERWDEYQRLKK